jgi:hypothetical protein
MNNTGTATFRSKLEQFDLLPITRKDIVAVLCNPFVEKYHAIVALGKQLLNWNTQEVLELVEEVAIKCLEIGSKVAVQSFCACFHAYSFLALACRVKCLRSWWNSIHPFPIQ